MNIKKGITDTHAHLCDAAFDPDRVQVLKRAASAGVRSIICVGEDIADAKRNIELATIHPGLMPAAGLYPSSPDLQRAGEMIAFIRENRNELFAIGEVGLDHWILKEERDRDLQEEIFGMFIALSLEIDLPLNVHSRSAGRHAIQSLIRHGARRVQLHAFDGKASTAMPAVESGFFFSVPPSVVRSRQKQKLVKHLPVSCLLIETDSPVLGPLPGERNEPANALAAVRAIAEIKGMRQEKVVRITSENCHRLYGDMKGEIHEESSIRQDRA